MTIEEKALELYPVRISFKNPDLYIGEYDENGIARYAYINGIRFAINEIIKRLDIIVLEESDDPDEDYISVKNVLKAIYL